MVIPRIHFTRVRCGNKAGPCVGGQKKNPTQGPPTLRRIWDRGIGNGSFGHAAASLQVREFPYAEFPMWNVSETFEKKAMDSLAALGFGVGSTRGVVRVEKYGCGAEFRQDP